MLNEILTTDIYRFMLIFVRLAAALALLPGFGGQRVPVRMQLLFALSISFLLLPILGPLLPPLPTSVGVLVLLILGEALIGIFMAMVVQVTMAALSIAGTVLGFQVGMTNAFSFDAVAEQQSGVMASFLSNVALVIIFATDLHHLMLRAVVDTYVLFPPGTPLPLGDFAETLSHMLSASFGLGLQLAAPFVAFGLIFYTALGLLSRMAPQVQVFFVALPIQMMIGLWLLGVALPVIMMLFLGRFQDNLIPFLTPG